MTIQAIYAHTNLIAKDWRHLADFYIQVFGCIPLPPERDLRGDALERGTGIPGAHLQGMHLLLPGYGSSGPTLEIFTYEPLAESGQRAVNRPGYGHLAFRVSNLGEAREQVLAAGGKAIGEVVTTPVGNDQQISWCYLTDPEGNLLELQTVITHREA